MEQTISELGLTMAADVIVGGPFRKGISGGEKRRWVFLAQVGREGTDACDRLSIGCILVTLPSVLVLDEPTTGLDSFTAFQLLETLSRLAKRSRSVVLSIHQPRSDAFPLVRPLSPSYNHTNLTHSSTKSPSSQPAPSSSPPPPPPCSPTSNPSATPLAPIPTPSISSSTSPPSTRVPTPLSFGRARPWEGW